MNESDQEEFVSVLKATAEMYGAKLSDGAIGLYFEALKNFDLDSVRHGISAHIQDTERGQFMPKPADILRYFRPGKRLALLAWTEVEQAMLKVGRYCSVKFEDAATNAVIRDMGGWPWICDRNLDEPWTQKEFERRYDLYRDQRLSDNKHLPGVFEIENSARGHLGWIQAPRLISGKSSEKSPLLLKNGPEDGPR